ncbi:hypothetical protein HMI54_000929 [Coelomomyces lativittatus]|nr:hypothetical protein HMI54_000929 [Coelomomyces lativittatus]
MPPPPPPTSSNAFLLMNHPLTQDPTKKQPSPSSSSHHHVRKRKGPVNHHTLHHPSRSTWTSTTTSTLLQDPPPLTEEEDDHHHVHEKKQEVLSWSSSSISSRVSKKKKIKKHEEVQEEVEEDEEEEEEEEEIVEEERSPSSSDLQDDASELSLLRKTSSSSKTTFNTKSKPPTKPLSQDDVEKKEKKKLEERGKKTLSVRGVSTSSSSSWFRFFTKRFFLFWSMTILAWMTRFYRIDSPSSVVFDEVHFGKFASFYLRRTFYFDVHPPLGRLLFAGMGWMVGFDGHFQFNEIGDDYLGPKVPYVALRSLPAFCGAIIVPLVFDALDRWSFPPWVCALAALFLVLDNALITQSRLILLDSMLICFMVCSMYAWIRFSLLRHQPFTVAWWTWLMFTGMALGGVIGVKMVGLFTVFTLGMAVVIELWYLLDYRRTHWKTFVNHFLARFLCLVCIPISMYLLWFAIHFAVLTKTGPGDAFMSPSFQATLEGNRLSAQAQVVVYGASVTLRHSETHTYLHSHVDRYPQIYEDGRVSSQGQQVTAYGHKDMNNVWLIKPAHPNTWTDPALLISTSQGKKYTPVKHLDTVVLEHVSTKSHLYTHDVASPYMPTNQEFTTLAGEAKWHQLQGSLFRFELLHPPSPLPASSSSSSSSSTMDSNSHSIHKSESNADSEIDSSSTWLQSLGMPFRLVHVASGVSMFTHAKPLPPWGYGQQEVNGNKKPKDAGNAWFIEDVFYPSFNLSITSPFSPSLSSSSDPKVPVPPNTQALQPLGFLNKFWELQKAMLAHNALLTKPHPYQSPAYTWPWVLRGISFWENKKDQQIYLLPNPVLSWFELVSVLVYPVMVLMYFVFEKRNLISTEQRQFFYQEGWFKLGFLYLGWMCHYFPFFLMGRSLFYHHYLPASVFSAMILATCIDLLCSLGCFFFFGTPSSSSSSSMVKSVKPPPLPVTSTDVMKDLVSPSSKRTVSNAYTPSLPLSLPSRRRAGRRPSRPRPLSSSSYVTSWVLRGLGLGVLGGVMYSFYLFAPFSYGYPGLDPSALKFRQWVSTWDFQYLV